MILIIADTTGIQSYVFGSNRLQENIGASRLVKLATGQWAADLARTSGSNEVYTGGGNYLVTFHDEPQAKKFVWELSRHVMQHAPGLQLVIEQQQVDSEAELPEATRLGFTKLAQQKRCRALSAPLLGMGITRMCQSTGLPAIQEILETPEDDTTLYPASAEIIAKMDRVADANQALRRLFANVLRGTHYEFPRDLDHLGRSAGEHSFIAVVHADGNGLGQRFQELGWECERDGTDYRIASDKLSKDVERVGQGALQEILNMLIARVRHDSHEWGAHSEFIRLSERDPVTKLPGRALTTLDLQPRQGEGYFLPFRPLVFGGDDVTFVCDGRLGLSLATLYLESFTRLGRAMSDGGAPLTACAGIAIVPAHYPFARAYELAEQLCQSAKDYRRDKGWSGSCLDWQFAVSGPNRPLKAMREQEYTVPAGTLHQRPVTLAPNTIPGESLHSWVEVCVGTKKFQQEWASRHNKLKVLREELRGGRAAVQRFLAQTGIDYLPALPSCATEPDLAKTGWRESTCAYFDAVELADWFIALEDMGHQDARQDVEQAQGEIAHVAVAAQITQ